jgi:hypothetical protein
VVVVMMMKVDDDDEFAHLSVLFWNLVGIEILCFRMASKFCFKEFLSSFLGL